MKFIYISFLTTLLTILTISSVFSQIDAYEGYIGFRNQVLGGDDQSALIFKSNYEKNSQMVFMEKDSIIYGAVRGYSGTKFGLTDAYGEYFLVHKNQKYTKFKVANEEKMIIRENGNIGIGTDLPMYKLDVCGTIRAVEVLVEDDWCDYVFNKDYQLPTLEEEKEHIEANGHLLGFESEEAMNGEISLHDVTKRQQVKIEEYALQLIQLNEKNKVLEQENLDLAKKYETLETMLLELKNTIQKTASLKKD